MVRYLCARVWKVNLTKFRGLYLSDISRVYWCGERQDIRFKVKDNLLHLAHPQTKKEAGAY